MERFADLPVCVDLPGRLGQEVTAFVEAEAGWQVIGGDGPLLPIFTLAPPGRGAGRRVAVVAAPAGPDVVRQALLDGALDVIAWPDERERLLGLPLRIRPDAAAQAATPLLRIGACRGGVGASTVALAVGGMVAWAGGRALVVGSDGPLRLAGIGPWVGPGSVELAALGGQAAAEVERLAVPVPGVDGLSLLGGGALADECAGWPYDLVVLDVGAVRAGVGGAGVVVAAADASVAAAPPDTAVVVVEHGPLDRAAVTRCLGRSPAGWLPYSNRVARAGTAGRVPSALPGLWLQALRGALKESVA